MRDAVYRGAGKSCGNVLRHAVAMSICPFRKIVYSNHLLRQAVARRWCHMVDIAQLVEHLIVVQKVARSSRVIHPINP